MLLKIPDVAQRLNCSVSTVYNLVEQGRLPHHRCPGIRVSEEQVASYLDGTRHEPTVPSPAKAKLPRPVLKHIRL